MPPSSSSSSSSGSSIADDKKINTVESTVEESNYDSEESFSRQAGILTMDDYVSIPASAVRLIFGKVVPTGVDEIPVRKEMANRILDEAHMMKRKRHLSHLTIKSFGQHLRNCHNIVCMVGAGISVSAGIPDFRTPGSGLYSQLEKYHLPRPEAMFDLDFFKKKPNPFFKFAEELWPGRYQPTPVHRFMKALQDSKKLRRVYTQNIDSLERQVGISPDLLIEAHGTMHSARCVTCKKKYPSEYVKKHIDDNKIPLCDICRVSSEDIMIDDKDIGKEPLSNLGNISGLVKPDIVFFHEEIPNVVLSTAENDFPTCDAVIIMGTSMQVSPFCSLQAFSNKSCPRLLITKGASEVARRSGLVTCDNFGYRDVEYDGDCDDGVSILAREMGISLDV